MKHIQLTLDKWTEKIRGISTPCYDLYLEEIDISIETFGQTRLVVNIPVLLEEEILPTRVYYNYLKSKFG